MSLVFISALYGLLWSLPMPSLLRTDFSEVSLVPTCLLWMHFFKIGSSGGRLLKVNTLKAPGCRDCFFKTEADHQQTTDTHQRAMWLEASSLPPVFLFYPVQMLKSSLRARWVFLHSKNTIFSDYCHLNWPAFLTPNLIPWALAFQQWATEPWIHIQ